MIHDTLNIGETSIGQAEFVTILCLNTRSKERPFVTYA